MPRYRIHRMKEVPRESFRWAAHTGGLAEVRPKDYAFEEEIEAHSPYQVWKLMAEQGRVLYPGDLLEICATETDPQQTPPAMWIAKYIGFEPAQWWVPDIKPVTATGPEEQETSSSPIEACPS